MNPYADAVAGGSGGSGDGGGSESECVVGVSYAAVAARLLQDNFLLTALELHTELVESGRELPQLREFFSNPGNFEQHVSRADAGMHRTPSQATLDSLDLARYSEDGGVATGGGGSSDVAVLEFELRKARETINCLRANLTQFADRESDTTKERLDGGTLKPHEKRALNFLVNEYLLLESYKLTAITFSDENPDQDFEDWDDVGLNLPRPCGLISLYRGETVDTVEQAKDYSTDTKVLKTEVECQTDPLDDVLCANCQNSYGEEIDWNHEIIIQAEEILLLKRQIIELETDKANYQKLYDAALASLNSLTTPVSDSPALDLSMPADKLALVSNVCVGKVCEQALMYAENHYGSNTSTSSVTPEQFEMIECEKNNRKEGAESCSLDVTPHASPMRRGGSENTLDDTLSLNEAGEWTRLQHSDSAQAAADTLMDSSLPSELKSTILEWCCGRPDSARCGNDLVDELSASDKPVTPLSLVPLAADTLLRILPHTLVSRRCEAAALVAATAHLLTSLPTAHATRRAKLLQMLLTLLKKPDPSETNVISQAICLIVRWGGSGEVLSCVAELLSSRSAERRLLAANVCVSVAPHVPADLSASLLLSLVLVMCESTDHEIRDIGLRTAILICLVAENKYAQFEGIVFAMIKDPVEQIRKRCVGVFVPVLARCAIRSGKFASDLCHRTISQLSKYSSESDWKNTALYLDILRVLAVATLTYVANVQIVKDNVERVCDERHTTCDGISIDNDELCLDLQCYLCDFTLESTLLVDSMNRLLKETPDVRWKELNWFLDEIIHKLLEISMSCKLLNHSATYHIFIRIFNTYCNVFGREFTEVAVKPILSRTTVQLEKKLETLQPVDAGNLVSAGIFLAAVLPSCCEWEKEICDFLKRWVVCMGVCGLPVDVLAEPLKWLATHSATVFAHCLRCISEVVANAEERSTAVRAGVATLLADLATSSDLPDDCFDTDLVPTVGQLLNHSDEGVRERSITALGAVTRAAVSRALPCRGECWRRLEEAAAAVERSGEAARVADALSVLLAPGIEGTDAHLPMQVLSLLCRLCLRAPLTADVCSSLIPGLQLAVHFARPPQQFIHSELMPALRRLEKIDSPSLQQHKQAVDTLVQSLEPTSAASESPTASRQSGILARPEAVGRRVTQIFQHSKTNINIPNIFKKKS